MAHVFIEVDAALDNVNVKKICNYIKQRSKDFQCVVISLKDIFFEHADALVGICKDVDKLSSKILTLDLNAYADTSLSDAPGLPEDASPQQIPRHSPEKTSARSGADSVSASKRRPHSSSAGILSGSSTKSKLAIHSIAEELSEAE